MQRGYPIVSAIVEALSRVLRGVCYAQLSCGPHPRPGGPIASEFQIHKSNLIQTLRYLEIIQRSN